MNDQLLGYLLKALDADTHRQVEAYVNSNPEAQRRLQQLQVALEPLAADRGGSPPPRDLVIRTLGRVAEHCCREMPRAPVQVASQSSAGPRSVWLRADMLVAAAVLLTVLGFGASWVLHLRQQAIVTECQDNLRQFYVALKEYSEQKKHFPNVAVAAKTPRNIAGLVVPILRDAGMPTDSLSVRCPANGTPVRVTWSIQDLQQMDESQFDQVKSKLVLCYGYSLGYRHQEGVILSLDYDPKKPLDSLPIMSDGPARDASKSNSPNHGGKGQNVLYADGHVRFCTTRDVGYERDDIFLNLNKQPKTGLNWKDAVLGVSDVIP